MKTILVVSEYCSGAMAFILAALTTCDAIGRYAFNSPIAGATEMSELFLVSIISLSFPAITAYGEHVDVDILLLRLRPFAKRLVLIIGNFIGTILFGIMTVLGFMRGLEALHSGQITNVLRIRIYPFLFLFSLACCLTFCVQILRIQRLVCRKNPDMK